jgi:hypothetical protein
MPRMKMKVKGRIEAECLPPGEFFWFALSNRGGVELVAACWKKSVRSWTPEQIARDRIAERHLERWQRLFGPATGAGRQRAARAEKAAGQAWLRERVKTLGTGKAR